MGRRATGARRAATLTALAVLMAASLSGCTPAEIALVGVGVDENGSPVAYLHVCKGRIDRLVLEQPDIYGHRLVVWSASVPVTDDAVIQLRDDNGSWTANPAMTELQDGLTYTIAGWDSRKFSSGNAVGVRFTTADLAALKPGDVRSISGQFDGGGNLYTVQDEAGFAAHGCQYVHDEYGTV